MNGTPLRLIDGDDGFAITVGHIGPYTVVDLPGRVQIIGSDAEAMAEVFEVAARELRGAS